MSGNKMLDAMEMIDADLIEESFEIYSPKRKHFKKNITFVLVAVLIMGLAVVAGASANANIDASLAQLMGLENNSMQLPDGSVALNFDTSCNGSNNKFNIVGGTCVGDRNTAFVKLYTDYKVTANYNSQTDYYSFEDYSMNYSHPNNPFDCPGPEGGSSMSTDVEDGKLVIILSLDNVSRINTATINLSLRDIYLWHDKGNLNTESNEELVSAGEWNVDWTFAYKTKVKKYKLNVEVNTDQGAYTVKRIEMSPLGINVYGKTPKRKKGTLDGIEIEEIIMTDGRVIATSRTGMKGFGSMPVSRDYQLHGYVNTAGIGEFLKWEDVKAIVVDGKRIAFHEK